MKQIEEQIKVWGAAGGVMGPVCLAAGGVACLQSLCWWLQRYVGKWCHLSQHCRQPWRIPLTAQPCSTAAVQLLQPCVTSLCDLPTSRLPLPHRPRRRLQLRRRSARPRRRRRRLRRPQQQRTSCEAQLQVGSCREGQCRQHPCAAEGGRRRRRLSILGRAAVRKGQGSRQGLPQQQQQQHTSLYASVGTRGLACGGPRWTLCAGSVWLCAGSAGSCSSGGAGRSTVEQCCCACCWHNERIESRTALAPPQAALIISGGECMYELD
jgi:hypothetical protein